jgi:hypothetical protein
MSGRYKIVDCVDKGCIVREDQSVHFSLLVPPLAATLAARLTAFPDPGFQSFLFPVDVQVLVARSSVAQGGRAG